MNSYRANLDLGTLHFVFAPRFLEELSRKQQGSANLPEPSKIINDLRYHSQAEGVAAIVKDNEEGKHRLWIFIDTYYLEFYELDRKRDGYRLANINAVNLYANNQLARGYILVRADWHLHQSMGGPSGIPQGSSSHWNSISREWEAMEQARQSQASRNGERQIDELTETQKKFLTSVNDLVEATRSIEQEKHKNPKVIPYSSFERTAEEQYELRSIYVFHLAQKQEINPRDMLRLTSNKELGRIFTLEGERLTVKFERAIDENSIDPQGTFETVSSEVSFRAQQNAVEMLQKREGNSRHLLNVLVDRKYRPYIPGHEEPDIDLNGAQKNAFQRALSVPDLLLVLGPPGTGKTQTIREIVKAYEKQKKRILVTSKTNRAVDNALEKLISDDLLVIRFGHEDSVSDTMRGQLIDTQADRLQKEILTKTNEHAEQLTKLMTNGPYIAKWLEQLQKDINELGQLESNLQEAQRQIDARHAFYTQQYSPRFELLISQRKKIEGQLNRRQQWLAVEDGWKRRLESWRQTPIVGLIWLPLLALVVERWQTYKSGVQKYDLERNDTQRNHEQQQYRLERDIQGDNAYRYYREHQQNFSKQYAQTQNHAQQVSKTLHGYIQQLTPYQEPTVITAQAMTAYLAWYGQQRQLFGRHYKLLNTWRNVLEKHVKALYSELLLYADVVGATCIGVASVQALSEASFHAAIVDEAGQINLLDLLVPLVKAEKAILVGDHQQLPPFVDSDVQDWLKSLEENEESADSEAEEATEKLEINLLKKSMFELLYDGQTNPDNTSRLNIQYRMPKVIADYAARQFYESDLETAEQKAREVIFNDRLFQKPLVFVDTAQLPRKIRYDSSVEWRGEKTYSVSHGSTFNLREAELIAKLACMYQNEHTRWIVIVPYNAQAQRIRDLLAAMPQMAGVDTEYLVATVDSFQGGESPVVIYGFTRSNPWKTVGFLSEVRRLNVALTRAQQRLILVGDSQTLTIGPQQQSRGQRTVKKNARFYAMMNDLYAHTGEQGQILPYQECMQKVERLLQ